MCFEKGIIMSEKDNLFYLFEIERLNNEIKELNKIQAEMIVDLKSKEKIIKDLKAEVRKKSKWLSNIRKHIGDVYYRNYKQ
jgi:septal ring factor EnvC (AmiA/AmiB activator)